MAKYQGIVKDMGDTLPNRKTKFYDTYMDAHNAAEKLCKRTYGNRGTIDAYEAIRKGDWVNTPRFLKVKIQEVYKDQHELYEAGYKEPTHYDGAYIIQGKHTGLNRMQFAAAKRN